MEYEKKYWYLRNHTLFNQLEDSDISDLCIVTAFKEAEKNEIIYFSDEEIKRLYFLKKGRIKIAYFSNDDIETTSEILMEGDIFGALGLKVSRNKNKEFAEVISDSVSICSITIDKFKELLLKKPELAITYTQMVGEKLQTIGTKYTDLIFKDVKTRVINFYKSNAKYEGLWDGQKVELNMYLSHQAIANYTASSRQTVSTVIGELMIEGKLIYESRKKVIIPDFQKL